MSLRNYIVLMVLATLICYASLISVLMLTNPFNDSYLAVSLFYASLFLSLVGTFAIIGLALKMLFTKDKLAFKKVVAAFRQGIWFSLLVIVSLYLKRQHLLVLSNLIILIFAFALLELFIISYKAKPKIKV